MTEAFVLKREKSLVDLAKKINKEHRLCEESLKAGLQHALTAGELLIKAKKQVNHGVWLSWLHENCECSERTTQAYMRVFRLLPTLPEGKAQRVADLSFREAMKFVGKDVARLKLLSENEQNEVLDTADSEHKTISQCVRDQVSIGYSVRYPPKVMEPISREARVSMLFRHKEEKRWLVELGPSLAGIKLMKEIEEIEGTQEYLDELNQAGLQAFTEPVGSRMLEALKGGDAPKAHEELNKYEDRIRKLRSEFEYKVRQVIKERIEREYGPAKMVTEGFTFKVTDPEIDEHLKTLPKEEIIKFLFENRGSEIVLETNRLWWGDYRFIDDLEPSLDSDGWDGTGGADQSLSAQMYGRAKLEPTQVEHKPLETIQ